MCSRSDVDGINAALVLGSSLRDIASRFGVGKNVVAKHAKHVPVSRHANGVPAAVPAQQDNSDRSRARASDEEPTDGGPDFTGFPPDRDGRVRFVMRLMAMGSWVTGQTGRHLAAVAGLHEDTVRDYASEASRRVKAVTDVPMVRQRLAAALEEGIDLGLAMARGEAIDDEQSGERRWVNGNASALSGIANCAKAFAALVGAEAPKRHELTGADGAPLGLPAGHPLATLGRAPTLDELEAYAARGEVPTPKSEAN